MTCKRSIRRGVAGAAGAVVLVFAASALAQGTGSQVFRYEDAQGRVIYSDKPPPNDAKKAQAKRIGANFIETDATPLATQQATERFPVTLYTFACGEVCQSAEGLLNKRGVPFTTVNVEEPANAARLQALTGELTAPVLQVGDKLVAKGYNEIALDGDARRRRLPEGAAAAPHRPRLGASARGPAPPKPSRPRRRPRAAAIPRSSVQRGDG